MWIESVAKAKNSTAQALKTASVVVQDHLRQRLKLQEAWVQTPRPTRASEDWKYVDLKFLDKVPFEEYFSDEKNVVSVDGQRLRVQIGDTSHSATWSTQAPLPAGVHFYTQEQFVAAESPDLTSRVLRKQWARTNYFADLNDALTGSHIFVVIDREFDPKILIELSLSLPISELPRATQSRITFVVKAGGQMLLLEKSYLAEQYFLNCGFDYFLEDSAQLTVLKLEKGAPQGWGCHTARYSLAKNAKLFSTTATVGSFWSRHNAYVELEGEGADSQLLATYLAEAEQFVDHHTTIDHTVPHTTSLQKYTGVLDDKARAVFNGRVHIARNAQKSSAVQMNRNLLLSKTAEINTKPELLIDADDVQAKHGATVGQIQPEELFYLQSRGIPEQMARSMLTRGFIEEVALQQPTVFRPIFLAEVNAFLQKAAEA